MNAPEPVNALTLSNAWSEDLDLTELVRSGLADLPVGTIDVVAIGKASVEMTRAVNEVLGGRLSRQLVVSNTQVDDHDQSAAEVWVGDHPVPGPASLAAGHRLVEFLATPGEATTTLFLVSGGASSLCVAPAAPMGLSDLAEVWRLALEAGLDITQLNQLRASTSLIAGGAVLRSVRTPCSTTLVMVDNVISGAPWVASGLTYEYAPSGEEFELSLEMISPASGALTAAMRGAYERRAQVMAEPVPNHHDNAVIAEPAMMLERTVEAAHRAGYRVESLGADLHGDVETVVGEWGRRLRDATRESSPLCLVGVGEVTVRVSGTGRGGRCQEFAWRMAPLLASLGRPAMFVARASDGRDFVEGVAGAWTDSRSIAHARELGLDWDDVAARHDTGSALASLGQLLEGVHSGWNLCDLYLCLVGA